MASAATLPDVETPIIPTLKPAHVEITPTDPEPSPTPASTPRDEGQGYTQGVPREHAINTLDPLNQTQNKMYAGSTTTTTPSAKNLMPANGFVPGGMVQVTRINCINAWRFQRISLLDMCPAY